VRWNEMTESGVSALRRRFGAAVLSGDEKEKTFFSSDPSQRRWFSQRGLVFVPHSGPGSSPRGWG
jgi:hypothetical protein